MCAVQRPRYMELRAVMVQVPDINAEALDQYDNRLLNPNGPAVGDKKRKEQFKRLIAGTVGVSEFTQETDQQRLIRSRALHTIRFGSFKTQACMVWNRGGQLAARGPHAAPTMA